MFACNLVLNELQFGEMFLEEILLEYLFLKELSENRRNPSKIFRHTLLMNIAVLYMTDTMFFLLR